MTVISKRIFRPMPGKAALVEARVKRLGEALARAGARVRVGVVAWGDGARDLHLYGVFPNLESGAKANMALMSDPEALKLREESEREPSSHWEGPEVWRTVFGETKPQFPVLLQREYAIDRRHLKRAVEMLSEVQALRPDRPVVGVVPVVAADMARLMVGYYAESLADLGQMIDSVGMSEAFQAVVVRAAELGTLKTARVVVNL